MGRTTYADNALNRKMGRVGQPYRFAVTYRQQTTRRRGRRSKRGKRRKRNPKRSVKRGKRVYVDNAQNRRLNRVGKSYARSGGRTAKAPKSRRLNEREWGARQRRHSAYIQWNGYKRNQLQNQGTTRDVIGGTVSKK